MGQNATAAGVQQPPAQGAVKINFDEMRPTTRYVDCIDDIQRQLESIDKMIQSQERFCREIEAFIPAHGQNVASLSPDVELVKEKADAVEGSLSVDAGGVEAQRKVLEKDRKDFQRCERVVMNLAMPVQYRYTGQGHYGGTTQPSYSGGVEGEEAKDMDLIGNYFVPMAADLKKTLDTYASNLSEIEGHMRVIEQSTVVQAQQLASRRAGTGAQASSEDTVRELADTLRGFEASILGAAGLVGQCREGVNELVLGRLGGRGWEEMSCAAGMSQDDNHPRPLNDKFAGFYALSQHKFIHFAAIPTWCRMKRDQGVDNCEVCSVNSLIGLSIQKEGKAG